MNDWLAKNWLALVALGVAIFAATMGTVNAYLNWRNNRRRLKVRARFGHTMFGTSGKPMSREMLIGDVRSVGPSEMTNVYVQPVKSKKTYRTQSEAFSSVSFVHNQTEHVSFHPGKLSHDFRKDGLSGIIKIQIVVRERAGRVSRSQKIGFDVDRYATEYDGELQRMSAQIKETFEKHAPSFKPLRLDGQRLAWSSFPRILL